MARGSSVLRRGALVRQSALTRTAMKVKPAKRDPAEAEARAIVKARSLGLCEMDGTRTATDMHHRVNRSQGGMWSPENLLHLCHEHHMHITTNPRIAQEQGWSIPSHLDPARTPAWIARRGFVLLNSVGDYITDEDTAA